MVKKTLDIWSEDQKTDLGKKYIFGNFIFYKWACVCIT